MTRMPGVGDGVDDADDVDDGDGVDDVDGVDGVDEGVDEGGLG